MFGNVFLKVVYTYFALMLDFERHIVLPSSEYLRIEAKAGDLLVPSHPLSSHV